MIGSNKKVQGLEDAVAALTPQVKMLSESLSSLQVTFNKRINSLGDDVDGFDRKLKTAVDEIETRLLARFDEKIAELGDVASKKAAAAAKDVAGGPAPKGSLPVGPDGEIIHPEAMDVIKVPYVRIGTEGQVQLLAERLEALQKRMDLLTKTVSELRGA